MTSPAPVVCTSALPWAGLQTSRHHLARHLARSREVLFVDPPENALRSRPRWRPRLHAVEPGITVLTPTSHLPYGPTPLFRLTTPVNQHTYARSVAWGVARMGWHRPILWNASLVYPAPLVAEAITPRVHLFHLTDAIWDYPWFRPEYEGYLEHIMSTVTLAAASSESLTERLARYGRPTHHLPHGVDPEVFLPAALGDLPIPSRLAAAARPRFGFIGNIEARLDVDLLCRLASTSGSVTLVGPVSLPRGDLERLTDAGCRIEPQVAYQDVPAWMGGFDVALLPYQRTDLVVHSRPLKLLEYLAAGLPVVSVDIPAARELLPHLEVAQSTEGFVAAAQAAATRVMSGLDADRRAARAARAQADSWEERAITLNSLLEDAEEMG